MYCLLNLFYPTAACKLWFCSTIKLNELLQSLLGILQYLSVSKILNFSKTSFSLPNLTSMATRLIMRVVLSFNGIDKMFISWYRVNRFYQIQKKNGNIVNLCYTTNKMKSIIVSAWIYSIRSLSYHMHAAIVWVDDSFIT